MTGTRVPVRGRLVFEAPAQAWSTNQDRNLNPYRRAENISLWKDRAFWAYRSSYAEKPNWEPSIIMVTIPFTQRRRRDPHNYCGTVLKAIIDGLVRAGAWPDDTPEYIGHREPRLYKAAAQNQIVTVEWWPMTEEEPHD